jgi:hypoxanthine phosphoribosyltransferase
METFNISKPAVFISTEQIQGRINEMAAQIEQFYVRDLKLDLKKESPVLIGVLKGAFIFTADLVRQLGFDVQLEFVRLASYGDGMESGNLSAPDLALPNITGRHILILEDIVDTGKTAQFLKSYLQAQFSPASLKLASLLSKPSRRETELEPDFMGFEIEDKFVIGYGLDYAERYRDLPYLGVLNEAES